MHEKVGILIPLYNNEKKIEECLNSVKNQTYKNLEVIIIDDGSTDKSLEVCKQIIKDDSRFKLHSRENRGVAFSRNEAIKYCTANYFIFLDSDDFLDEDFIETTYKILKENDVDIVSTKISIYKDRNKINKENKNIYTYIVNREAGMEKLLYQYEIQHGPTCKLYKKKLFEGIEFPNGKIYEDLATIYKIVDRCNSIAITSYNGYNYYYNINGITKSEFDDREIFRLKCAEEIYEFVNQKYNKSILIAAKNLLVSQCLFVICKMPIKKEYEKSLKDIKSYISKYRLELLKDSNTHLKTKIFLTASYFGLRGIKILNYVMKLLGKNIE